MKKIFIISLASLLFFSCKKNDDASDSHFWTNRIEELREHNKNKITIVEGVWGTLTRVEGNCMPVHYPESSCKQYPVKRVVEIYEYTTLEQADYIFPSFFDVKTKLIKKTTCDEDGFFEVQLGPGRYSLFIREEGRLYARLFDGDGGINSFIVEPSTTSESNQKLDYAVY